MTEPPAEFPTLAAVLACPTLPSLPAVALQVLELTRQPEVKLPEIARVVEHDPALAAKVLRTVNSSFYALQEPCSSIARALPYLGLATVKSLVLGFSLVNISDLEPEGVDLSDYWRRCLYSAAAARRLAERLKVADPEEAFAAALMQDLGMLALHMVARRPYQTLISETHGDHRRLAHIERERMGYDHAEVGGCLAEQWGLPEPLREAIRHHHDAGELGMDQYLARIVGLSADIASAIALPNPGAAMTAIQEEAASWFGLPSEELSGLVRGIADDAHELRVLFDMQVDDPIDINWILAEAQEASVQHQVAVQQEAETLRRSNDELSKMVLTDGLTNVGNRTRFDNELSHRYDQARAFKGTLGLIIADADRFKLLNDTYGHQVGDAVLVELAERLKKAVRGIDLVCRYGGEEFGIVLPGASIRDVAAIAERLRLSVVCEPFTVDGHDPLTVTISLGAAVYDTESAAVLAAPQLLLKAADKALYAAKDGGRNCVRVFRVAGREQEAA